MTGYGHDIGEQARAWPGYIIGNSASLTKAMNLASMVAPTDATVLLLGETGTGKELLAQAIHELSERRPHPFIKINCASIPFGLLESELFGYERGAFTGAVAQKLGRFEVAHGGTLFLDEIGDIALELQPKLLRVLQEQKFERLGSNKTHNVNVRVIAATNRDLTDMVQECTFREDLYYRLSVFPIEVPALRHRAQDIPALVRHFTALASSRLNRCVQEISDITLDALVKYSWPGNIRELQNFIERSVILSPKSVLQAPIHELDLRAAVRASQGSTETLDEAKRKHILRALHASGWVVGGPNGAAKRLGIKRTSLLYKMQRLNIKRPNPMFTEETAWLEERPEIQYAHSL